MSVISEQEIHSSLKYFSSLSWEDWIRLSINVQVSKTNDIVSEVKRILIDTTRRYSPYILLYRVAQSLCKAKCVSTQYCSTVCLSQISELNKKSVTESREWSSF